MTTRSTVATHVAWMFGQRFLRLWRPCPCGCRSRGFQAQWVRQGGLRGFAIISQTQGFRRFPRPGEVAFWNAIPASLKLQHSACWARSPHRCRAHGWPHTWFKQDINSKDTRHRLRNRWRIAGACERWVTGAMFVPRSITVCVEQALHQVQLHQPATISTLIAAEKDLGGNGCRVPPNGQGRTSSGTTTRRADLRGHLAIQATAEVDR